jgi:hypothetical protein
MPIMIVVAITAAAKGKNVRDSHFVSPPVFMPTPDPQEMVDVPAL